MYATLKESTSLDLFLISIMFLLALFIPYVYTTSVTFGPWQQSKTQYKVFCCMGAQVEAFPFWSPKGQAQILDWSITFISIGSLSDFFSINVWKLWHQSVSHKHPRFHPIASSAVAVRRSVQELANLCSLLLLSDQSRSPVAGYIVQ